MMVVGDTTDMFMPLLDGFLCDPGKSSHVIDALMEQIPTQFNETRTTETVLLPAIKAGMEALKVHMILSFFLLHSGKKNVGVNQYICAQNLIVFVYVARHPLNITV